MDALARLTQALDSGATSDLRALGLDAAVCCEAATAAVIRADAQSGGPQAAQELTACATAATRVCKLLGAVPDGCAALAACAPQLVSAVEALAHYALFDATWHGAVSEEVWRAAGGTMQALALALLQAASAHGATCAEAPDVVRMMQRLAEAAAASDALGPRFSVSLCASLCTALALAAGGDGNGPPAMVAACAGEACASLARCCADASRRAASCGTSEIRKQETKLAAFFAQQALRLAAKAKGGAGAWKPLLEACVAARRAQAACGEGVWAADTAHAVVRTDACVYRTLESPELDEATQARLLAALCCVSEGPGAQSLEEALADAVARCGLVADALLLRTPQHTPRLRAAAAACMRWALRTACCDCTAATLALPPQQQPLLRARLLAALGACLSACAAGAAEPGGAAAWAAAEAFLFDAAVDAHPLLRATALDAWASLAAAAPPALASRHVTQLVTLMAACLAGAPAEVGLDAVRCAAPRGCPASQAPTPQALAAARLAAATTRLLSACPDNGALAGAVYSQLLAGGATCDPFGAPPAPAALLCAGFPLARLRGAAAEHAAQRLPRSAVAEAQTAVDAVLPNSGTAMLDASPAAHRLHRCARDVPRRSHRQPTDTCFLLQLPGVPDCAAAAVRDRWRPGCRCGGPVHGCGRASGRLGGCAARCGRRLRPAARVAHRGAVPGRHAGGPPGRGGHDVAGAQAVRRRGRVGRRSARSV
jgi:hypothetical protein